MAFNWRRWLLKELSSLFTWLSGITVIVLFKYPELTIIRKMCVTSFLVVILLLLTAPLSGYPVLSRNPANYAA